MRVPMSTKPGTGGVEPLEVRARASPPPSWYDDPHFEDKLVDVVGLYMSPPERAVVFSFDEKTQAQALDRSQPSLPLKPGRGTTLTHE
jgi:hypothetical protein